MSFLDTYGRYPVELVAGDGLRVKDAHGRWYLDGICGIAVMALGHAHPAVTAAVHAQVDRLVLVRLRPPPFFKLQVRSIVGNDYEGEIIVPDDGDWVFP